MISYFRWYVLQWYILSEWFYCTVIKLCQVFNSIRIVQFLLISAQLYDDVINFHTNFKIAFLILRKTARSHHDFKLWHNYGPSTWSISAHTGILHKFASISLLKTGEIPLVTRMMSSWLLPKFPFALRVFRI